MSGRRFAGIRHRLCAYCRRHRRRIRAAAILGVIGLGYYLLITLTPLRIPCMFQKVTGLACPGCGITHFCLRLIRLDFVGAARENLALACLAPLWGAMYLVRGIWHPAWLKKDGLVERVILFGSIGVLLAFGVLRNLPGMAWLLPSYLR